MNKGQNLIASLLALCAVLLTLNLVMQVEPQAQAQVQAQASTGLPGPPVVIAGVVQPNASTPAVEKIYRFWNNGAVDVTQFSVSASCNYNLSCFAQVIGACHDLDGDGTVGVLDLLALLADWGPCL